MKIFREEPFGGVVYDTSTLRYQLIDEKDMCFADKTITLRKAPERQDILSAPIRVYFEITRKCNLHCRHCFASSSPSEEIGMSTASIMSLLDEMKRVGVIDVRFTGGEPTVRSDLYEILDHAKRLGLVVSLNTNGVYDNAIDTIDQLAKLDLDQVTISVDGMEETHNYLRGRGTFGSMLSSVKVMYAKGILLRFNTVITRRNVNEVPRIVELASHYAREINFFYMRPIGRALGELDTILNFEEHFSSARNTLALRSKYPLLNIMHFEQSFTERSIFPSKNAPPTLSIALPYGSTTLAIAADGSFWPHGYTPYQKSPEFKLGGFPQNSIEQIWSQSEKLDAIRRWLRVIVGRCQQCPEYRRRCAGLNFEVEVARLVGDISENPYCINASPIPSPWDFL